ncbi:AAA family ATPase [Halothermothrix orenii]|uniref:ATPase associated with various cellular activities AAA_3 n=1 Tax=Halothermothrix orenii (strain H 168 / OCM 544 / DSM 9562) TaxID=373903 RepID=B8CZD1_HALOH|nr:MoxR family ATPase [Halothermothrix orenii]ACL70650.1 ATPase associated with various cellular activities AAA_3 [Halothermothrix orenii H 168]
MDIGEKINLIINNVSNVILGKSKVIKLALASMLSEGHILFEDVPGVGKTVLARSLARSIGCSFKRVQFTPDLLPSDITGVSVYNQKTNEFEFRKGPILSQVVLADEINRGTPRTQSSLLEGMAEKQVTVDGVTRQLPSPFIVMATQNPIDFDGTFPLPEAQLDRFLVKLNIGYPGKEDEANILTGQQFKHPVESIEPVVSDSEFLKLQEQVKKIHVTDSIKNYIVEIVRATREHQALELGVSPRGSLGIFKLSQAWAAIQGRDYVIPDDVKVVAPYVLKHRMVLKSENRLRGREPESIVSEILSRIEVPVEVK